MVTYKYQKEKSILNNESKLLVNMDWAMGAIDAMSPWGVSKVRNNITKHNRPFCIDVSNEMAIIWDAFNLDIKM